jgi:hypothetical protein
MYISEISDYKKFLLTSVYNLIMFLFCSAPQEGRIAIVTKRGVECDGRDGVERERALQGGFLREVREQWLARERHGADSVFARASMVSTRQPSNVQRGRARTAKSCGSWRPKLASSLAEASHTNRSGRRNNPRDDGGNRARLTGEITK